MFKRIFFIIIHDVPVLCEVAEIENKSFNSAQLTRKDSIIGFYEL